MSFTGSPFRLGLRGICSTWPQRLRRTKMRQALLQLAMNGATWAEIAETLGYKTLTMVKRYAHLTEAHTRSVVERMNRTMFGES
jgi:AraC-like DNA-binding protein